MASDITLAVGDGTRRATHAELPDTRGPSGEADRPDKRTYERALDILSAQVERELARADWLYARLTEARASSAMRWSSSSTSRLRRASSASVPT
jgi:hypothetical protein